MLAGSLAARVCAKKSAHVPQARTLAEASAIATSHRTAAASVWRLCAL